MAFPEWDHVLQHVACEQVAAARHSGAVGRAVWTHTDALTRVAKRRHENHRPRLAFGDQTRAYDTGNSHFDRNGEPEGELGLPVQKDGQLWKDQTGAPIDPQPGIDVAVLRVRTGPAKGKETRLDRSMVTLGRPGVQVVVISRRKDAHYANFIPGASNKASKPTVNGKPMQLRATRLKDGDVINLAGVEIEFKC